MGVFETLAKTGANKMPIVESYSINLAFVCVAILGIGAVVKLNADGTVSAVTAEADIPFGIVVVSNKLASGKVTIQTNLSAVVLGKAFGTTVVANQLAAKSWDATNQLTVYDVAVSTDYISGVALTGGAANDTITVGLNRMPILKP